MKTFNRELHGQRAEGEFVGRSLSNEFKWLENLESINYPLRILKSETLWKFSFQPTYNHQWSIHSCFMNCFPSIGGKPFGLGISGWLTARNLPGFSGSFTSELFYRSFLRLALCRRKAVAVWTSPLQTFEFHGNHVWQFDEAIAGLKECPYTLQTQCITTWRCPKISKMGVPLGSSSIDP